MRVISSSFLSAVCLFPFITYCSSQLLPKFSGIHNGNIGNSAAHEPNIDRIPKTGSLHNAPPVDTGKTITFRLSVQPAQESPTLVKAVTTPQSGPDFNEDAATRQIMNRLKGILHRAEKVPKTKRMEMYKSAVHDVTNWASTHVLASRPLNQAMVAVLNKLSLALHAEGGWRGALNTLSLSLIFFDRSVAGIETSEDTLRRARLVSNMGSVAMQDTNFQVALLYFHDVLMQLLGGCDENDLASAALIGKTYARLGGVYMATNDIPQAVSHLKEGAHVLHGVYHPMAAKSASDLDDYVKSIELMFSDSLHTRLENVNHMACDVGNVNDSGSHHMDTIPSERDGDRMLVSVLTAAAADRIRHTVVGLIVFLVTLSGLMTLLPVHSPVSGQGLSYSRNEPSQSLPSSLVSKKELSSPATTPRRHRRLSQTPKLTPMNRHKIARLPAEDEVFFSAAEARAIEHLRDHEYQSAESFLTELLKARFPLVEESLSTEIVQFQSALSVVECRLRYMLSKAKVGLEKFQEGEKELYRSIDSYLKLGVLDDVTVAALLDYSLAVIREQLYDDDGEDKFTPDRFVRAHNVFCSLLFCPNSVPGKSLPAQRFQLSGPVDTESVQSFGLISPAGVQMMSILGTPLAKSPFGSLKDMTAVPVPLEWEEYQGKYKSDDDMLKSLEKLFCQTTKRKEELGTLALMCSDFEDLAEEMDKCLIFEDFSIAAGDQLERCDQSVVNVIGIDNTVQEVKLLDVSTEQHASNETVDCPETKGIDTRLGSTTGDDFDGDTFDDLLVGQLEDGDVSRVALVTLQQSPAASSVYGSPLQMREHEGQDGDSFESPPCMHLHMRPGIAFNDSETKENSRSTSSAGTDSYLTDNSNWADIVRGTSGSGVKKRKSKQISQSPSPFRNSPAKRSARTIR